MMPENSQKQILAINKPKSMLDEPKSRTEIREVKTGGSGEGNYTYECSIKMVKS